MAQIFIIGFQKCGTTYLHNIISQHPEISSNKVKEPHYFSLSPKLVDDNIQQYQNLFESKNFLDSSVSYVHDDKALLSIKKYFPNARIIILIRNKVDRVLSAYDHTNSMDSPEDSRKLTDITNQLTLNKENCSIQLLENRMIDEGIKNKFIKKKL